MADEVHVDVILDPNEASAERAADPLEDALVKAMKAALATFATQMRGVARDMAAEFRKVGLADLSTDMRNIVADTKRAANAARDMSDELNRAGGARLAADMKGVVTDTKHAATAARDMAGEFNKAGGERFAADVKGVVSDLKRATSAASDWGDETRDAIADTRRAAAAVRDWSDDMEALRQRGVAVSELLNKSGHNAGLGKSIEIQLRRITELQQEGEERAAELARNPQLLAAFKARGEQMRTALLQDIKFSNKLIEQETQFQIGEQRHRTAVATGELRARKAVTDADRSRNVVAQQRAGALELEEARRISRLRLQDERSSAKQRLAIFQATVQQIRVLERGIAATVRGAGSLLGGAVNAVSGATGRITSLFRRSDSTMNAGLAPALERRASIFRRELRQTESVIQAATVRQSALLARAEVQASRGVAGLASGRSQLGSLLGGGLAIGGGFALITKLREGFRESVNLNESLNKTRQIFGDATDSILEFADTSVDALFVTKSAALEAAANFGIFGRSAGLAGPELAEFSKRLTLLATDLASFNNTTIGDATTAIAAALRGESEPIRKYGVLLNEAVLQQRALTLGITDTIRKLTPQERVLAANAEILAQTAVQQGDAARTADDFANSARRAGAASTEFFASIAKFAVPAATILTNGVLPVFRRLTDFVNDEVGPAMHLLREGLIGAGTALGLLLAARVAGEALQFLAIGIRAVLTPMGLLVTSVALIGAAVRILAKSSPEFRRVFDDIRESVGDRLREGLELARGGLRRLGEIITGTILPAAAELALVVRDRLVSAFDATVRFVRTDVIPAFERFGRFLRDDVSPVILDIARAVSDRLEPVFRRVREFLQPAIDAFGRLGPAVRDALSGDFSTVVELLQPILDFIQPITDAFRDLGSVIGGVFSGDFGGALDRLRDFGAKGAAIAAVASAAIVLAFVNPFAGIAIAIAGALGLAFGPQLITDLRERAAVVVDRIEGFFSGDRLSKIGVGFLNVVRRIGEIIGSIVSDRRFVTGLVAVVAAIAAVAGSAIIGFAQGVRDNIPELVDLIGGALRTAFTEGFKFALSNPTAILAAIGLLFAGAALLSAFHRAGALAASTFGGGFLGGLRTVAVAPQQFLAGLFGGPGALAAAVQKEGAKAVKAFEAMNRDIAALGGTGRSMTSSLINPAEIAKSKDELAKLSAIVGPFGKSGAFAFDEITRGIASARDAGIGFKQILTGDVAGGFATVREAGKRFFTTVQDSFRRMKEAGVSAGQALGVGIGAGLSAALSGQLAGSSESGVGRGIGIAGIVSSAIFAAVAVPGGVGVALAGTTLAVGALTAVVSANERAAKKAKDEMAEYASALKDAATNSELLASIGLGLEQNLRDESQGVRDILEATSFSFTTFADQVLAGTTNGRLAAEEFFKSLGTNGEDALKVLADNPALDTFAEIRSELQKSLGDSGKFDLRGLKEAGVDIGALIDAFDFLDDEMKEVLGQRGIEDQMKRLGDSARNAGDGVSYLGGKFDAGGRRAAIIAAQNRDVTTSFDEFSGDQHRGVGGAAQALRDLRAEQEKMRLGEIRQALDDVNGVIDELNQKRTDRLNDEIDKVSDRLENAKDAAQLAKDAVTSFFTDRVGTADALTDQLLGSLGGVGTSVGEAVALGWETALGGAGLRTSLDDFGTSIAALIQQKITENPEITTAELSTFLDPVRAGINQAAALDPEDMFTQDAANALLGRIDGFLTETDFDAAVTFANTQQQTVTELEQLKKDLDLELEAKVMFSPAQIVNALAASLGIGSTEAAALLDLSEFFKPTPLDLNDARLAGLAVPEGVAAGIDEGAPEVLAAVSRMGTSVATRLTRDWGIASPSKVFKALGIEVPAGVAQGILDGAPGALAALRGFSSTIFNRLLALPGDFADNFRSVLTEIDLAPVADGLDLSPVVSQLATFDTVIAGVTDTVFNLVAAMEELGGMELPDGTFVPGVADLSKVTVGKPEGANPLSNSGITADKFAEALQFKFNASMPHPAGWVQSPDGTWGPPPVFAPPTPAAPSLDVREAPVVSPTGAAVRIDQVNITESTNARSTARETIMALRTAPYVSTAVTQATRVPADVVG